MPAWLVHPSKNLVGVEHTANLKWVSTPGQLVLVINFYISLSLLVGEMGYQSGLEKFCERKKGYIFGTDAPCPVGGGMDPSVGGCFVRTFPVEGQGA